MRDMVHNMLVQAANRGEIREDLDLDAVTRILNTLTIAVYDSQILPYLNDYFQVTGEDVSMERILDSLIDFIINGLGNNPKP